MASNSRPARRSLSEKLRGMRFMKQREEADLREKLAAEQAAREKAAHWTLEGADVERDTGPIVLIEEGVSDNPMHGRAGRQSFGAFNLKLEKRFAAKKSGNTEVKTDAKTEAKKEEDMIDVEANPQVARRQTGAAKGRGRERKILNGVRGGIAKKESRPLNFRFKKQKGFKGGRFNRPS